MLDSNRRPSRTICVRTDYDRLPFEITSDESCEPPLLVFTNMIGIVDYVNETNWLFASLTTHSVRSSS